MNTNYAAPSDLGRFQGIALGIGLIGVIAWIVGVVVSADKEATLYHTYLVAYIFWIGISLGCLGLLMIQYLGGAGWGLVIRRILESASHTLVLMTGLFIPIAIGIHHIYEWANLSHIQDERLRKLLEHKSAYLNPSFFTFRAVIYFAILLGLMFILRARSHKQDETGDPELIQSAQNWSGPGFVIYGLVCTFAAIDWVMSLDPEWFSTIFGLIMIAGQGVSAMAFIITICVILSQHEPMAHVYQPKHFHDFGKLQLTLVMVWAYFSFSQLLIIWSGNLPEEIPWFLERFRGVWRYLGLALILLHFLLPFLLLLSRDLKRNGRKLVMVAVFILLMRVVDLLWIIVPEFERGQAGHLSSYLIYIAALIGLGGLWLGWFFWQLRQRSLVPFRDPQLAEALAAGGGH
jgi:hypothetical protein